MVMDRSRARQLALDRPIHSTFRWVTPDSIRPGRVPDGDSAASAGMTSAPVPDLLRQVVARHSISPGLPIAMSVSTSRHRGDSCYSSTDGGFP